MAHSYLAQTTSRPQLLSLSGRACSRSSTRSRVSTGTTRDRPNAINAHLAERGLFLREGTIVDATLIAAPPSTKNKTGKLLNFFLDSQQSNS